MAPRKKQKKATTKGRAKPATRSRSKSPAKKPVKKKTTKKRATKKKVTKKKTKKQTKKKQIQKKKKAAKKKRSRKPSTKVLSVDYQECFKSFTLPKVRGLAKAHGLDTKGQTKAHLCSQLADNLEEKLKGAKPMAAVFFATKKHHPLHVGYWECLNHFTTKKVNDLAKHHGITGSGKADLCKKLAEYVGDKSEAKGKTEVELEELFPSEWFAGEN